jgi:hypothetical protein
MTATKSADRSWSFSSVLLVMFGASLVLMGLYFILLRPALLPEDLRYIGISQAQLETDAPHLISWLTHVFRVVGGYIAATGIAMIALALTSFRAHERVAAAGVLAAGLISIGLMTIVNFQINSDFRWVLLAFALVWACSLGAFWFEGLLPASAIATVWQKSGCTREMYRFANMNSACKPHSHDVQNRSDKTGTRVQVPSHHGVGPAPNGDVQ